MSETVKAFIPPLAVSRMIGSYHFEGGGYVAIVSDGNVPIDDLLDSAQVLIDMKRGEVARRKATLALAEANPEIGHE